MDRIEGSILDVIGEQGSNRTENIYVIWLLLKPKPRIKPADSKQFRIELFRFIDEVDQRWPSERFWQSPQGYWARNDDLVRYPVLQKYLSGLQFFPSLWAEGWPPKVYKTKKQWPEGQNWILFPARGGPFSSDTMLQPLFELLSDKIEHYGGQGTGFDQVSLVIHYNSALIYNSPVETPHFKFQDAADAARIFLGGDMGPFHNIFMFIAINDGRVIKIS
jgi:hypothetical protein